MCGRQVFYGKAADFLIVRLFSASSVTNLFGKKVKTWTYFRVYERILDPDDFTTSRNFYIF